MIELIDVLTLMNQIDRNGNPVPFQIKFFTIDGKLTSIDQAVKCIRKSGGKTVFDKPSKNQKTKKNPNHFANATRNILLPNREIRKLKIRLITEFNHKKVVYS